MAAIVDEGAFIAEVAVPLCGSAATTVAWRSRARLHLTVIAKSTFTFVADGPASRATPQEMVRAEVHHGDDPRRSVLCASDLAPYLPRADVLFTGSAYSPAGAPARSLPVRLAIFASGKVVMERRLLVQDSAGFVRMPIVYERALRGASGVENPFGVAPGEGEPNILDPAKPDRVAGLGPLGRAWPPRRRLLGETPRKLLEGPVAEIPDLFDWGYFNAAPVEQQTDYLRGDEWIVLEGLHPSAPRFRTRLPGIAGHARIFGLSAHGVAEGAPLQLVADTLHIDGDAQLFTVVCRQSFSLPSEAALAAVRVASGIEIDGEPLTWLEPQALRGDPHERAPSPKRPAPALDDTTFEGPVARHDPSRGPALPFVAIGPAQPACATPSPRAGASLSGARPFTGTLALSPDDETASLPGSDLPPGGLPPPALVASPPPIAPRGAAPVPLGLLAASDAAAAASAPPEERSAAAQAPPSREREGGPAPKSDRPLPALELLWFDPRSPARIRRQPAWRKILEELAEQPVDLQLEDPEPSADHDPAAAEDRREVFEVLAKGAVMTEDALRGALEASVRRDGRFVAPLVLLEGELSFPFDEVATLEATVAVVGPLAGGDEGTRAALAAARDFLSARSPLSSGAAAAGLARAIEVAHAQGKRAPPLPEVKVHIDQGLLDRRSYQRRALLGGPMLRGLLSFAVDAGAIPAYLPESLSETLPMFLRFPARLIAEARWRADQREEHPTALRVLALARLAG